jgi:hypothetical protein
MATYTLAVWQDQTMDALDEILGTKAIADVFHPVHQRDPCAWYPGNETASLLLQSQHVWEDILHLAGLIQATSDDYRKKLMLKYVFVELRSFLQVFDRLQSKVMQAIVFDPLDRENRPHRGITHEEFDQARNLYKPYAAAKTATERDIIQIRNNIGAHRGNLNWQEVMHFWDEISPETIRLLLDTIPPVFAHIKELNIYEWNRSPRDGTIEILGAVLYPDDLEPDD